MRPDMHQRLYPYFFSVVLMRSFRIQRKLVEAEYFQIILYVLAARKNTMCPSPYIQGVELLAGA